MTRKKPRVDAAALSFIRHNNPEDETFLIHFDDTARLAQGFSRDPAPIREMLASITPYGQTALFDAVRLALETVEAGEYSKKAILVISDGADNASQSDFQDVLDQVRQSGATLYAVGLFTGPAASASDPGASEALAHARSVLTAMAEAGGGRAFFPDSPDEVEALTIQIAQEIRDQYTLGYVPTNFRRDGTWRSLRLNVRPEARGGQIRLNYRHGYYAPPD
jgi:Ca-activated chloride channel family protein